MREPLVELTGVVARRGDFELQVPAWRVEPGTVVGVVGPNGAGKTTLLQLLPGLDRAQAGQVRVLGRDPIQDPVEVRSQLGFMTDDLPLFDLRIGALCRTLSGYYPTWDADLVEQLLQRFDLQPGARVRSLSRGQGTRLRPPRGPPAWGLRRACWSWTSRPPASTCSDVAACSSRSWRWCRTASGRWWSARTC